MRELVSPRAARAAEHPLRRGRAVVGVARVHVGARGEQQVDHSARRREVERRLAVAAALVHARGIVGDHLREQVGTIEVRGGAGVGNRARCEQPVGGGAGGDVQRVKPSCPPIAPPIRIGAELEQHLDHGEIVREGDDGRLIEGERRLVDIARGAQDASRKAAARRARRGGGTPRACASWADVVASVDLLDAAA